MFATTENENVNIKHSAHNQEFCEFIAEVIETLTDYHEAWFKLKEFITGLYAKAEYGGIEHCVTNYILEKMAKLEPKGDE